MPRGPKRAPARYWVPMSKGTPSTATSASILFQSVQIGCLPKVQWPTKGRFSLPASYPCFAIGCSERLLPGAERSQCQPGGGISHEPAEPCIAKVRCTGLRTRSGVRRRSVLSAKPAIDDPGNRRADDGCQPAQPELPQRPAAGEESRRRRAGRVQRGIGDGDTDQVDQREAEADGDRREPLRCPTPSPGKAAASIAVPQQPTCR